MLTESLLLSLSRLAALTGGILISKFLAQRLPDLLRPLRAAKTKQEEGGDMDTQTRVFCSGPYMLCGNVTVGKVDTKTLVVGQDVYMSSGCYGNKGKVVKLTPRGVDVQTDSELLHFDDNGRSYVTELPSSYDSTAHPLSPWRWNGNGTYECGPWELDDIPFAEREALLEQAAQRFRKWGSMDCEHSKIGEHYYIEKCTICGCDNPNYNPTAAKDRLQGKLPK